MEKTPDVNENDEMINVEFTVKLSAVICALDKVEKRDAAPRILDTVRLEPVKEVKYPVVVDNTGTWIEDLT